MDAKTYIDVVNSTRKVIDQLEQGLEDRKEEYLKEHAEFDIGEKVAVLYADGSLFKYAFVRSRTVGIEGYNDDKAEILYRLNGCKKDGSVSMNHVHVWNGQTLARVEGDNVSE